MLAVALVTSAGAQPTFWLGAAAQGPRVCLLSVARAGPLSGPLARGHRQDS